MALTVTSIVLTAAMCSVIMYIMIWHFRRRRLYKMASKFDGPPILPILGNAHLFMGDGEQLLIKLNDLTNSYPSPFRMWLGPILLFITTDPQQIKTVCTSPKTLEKGQLMRDVMCPWGGDGILLSHVSTWKVHRKLIQPTFNAKILDSFVEVFSTQSKIFVDQIAKNLSGPEFEIIHLVGRCTLDMICETTMGVKIEAQTDMNCHYVEAKEEVISIMAKRMFSVWLHPDFIFHSSEFGRRQRKHLAYSCEFTDNIIKTKKNQLLVRKIEQETVDAEDLRSRQRKVFLDYLMMLSDDGVSLSDKELREEINTMIFTGNDTTATTNTHLMSMLASYPDIQEKVYQELYEIYGDDDIEEHPVTPKDLPRMKYLERVIKETMRLFPVVPFIIREVTEDLDIGGDHTLPRGSSVAIGILAVHRSEKYWPDPLKFDPDRFLPEEIAKRHPYAFLAFSGGPRNCIGINYALMSMKTFAATVLRRYTLIKDNIVPIKDIRLKMEIALNPVEPIKIRIERRHRN